MTSAGLPNMERRSRTACSVASSPRGSERCTPYARVRALTAHTDDRHEHTRTQRSSDTNEHSLTIRMALYLFFLFWTTPALRIYYLQTYKKRIERIPICGLHKVHSTVEFKPTTLTAVVSGFGDRINHYFIRAVEWFKRPFRYFLPSVVGTIPPWDNILYDPQTAVLSMVVLCVHFTNVFKIPTNRITIFLKVGIVGVLKKILNNLFVNKYIWSEHMIR